MQYFREVNYKEWKVNRQLLTIINKVKRVEIMVVVNC